VNRCERLLVRLDLAGQGLVLISDVQVIADVGKGVGERFGRKDRL